MRDFCSRAASMKRQGAARSFDKIRMVSKVELLGDVVRELMDNQISQRQADFRSVEELWSTALPAELSRHCKIAGISGGKLTVAVDSPSYMYELQLSSCELLKELRRQCPRVPVEKIKLVLA